jgi:hypothetical protein
MHCSLHVDRFFGLLRALFSGSALGLAATKT